MKKSIYLFLFPILFAALSCSKIVDVKPRFDVPTEQALSTASDLEVAVNGAFAAVQNSGALGGAMRLVPDIISDEVQLNPIAYSNGQQTYFSAYQRSLYAAADNVWAAGYQAIERANNVIAAIDAGKAIDANTDVYKNNKDRLKGEALFVRAAMHFEIVRLYGHQYGFKSDAAQSGVVVKTKPTKERVGLARATTRETYAQIVSDFKAAIALLPIDYDPAIHPRSYGGRVGGRATKDAAKAYLAKVYFQKATLADNDSALALINQFMEGGKYWNPAADDIKSKDQNYFFKVGNQAAEQTIFQIVNNYNKFTNELNSSAATYLNAYLSSGTDPSDPTQAPYPNYIGSANFKSKCGSVLGGKRIGLYLDVLGKQNYYVFKFFRISGQPAAINFPILRGADFLLARAEINAYAGNLDAALADVNAVKAAAGATLLLPGLQQDTLIKRIAIERMAEMAFEGDRLTDFKRRAALDANIGVSGLHEQVYMPPGGVQNGRETNDFRIFAKLRWDDNASLLQIPDAEVFSNPNIKRNL